MGEGKSGPKPPLVTHGSEGLSGIVQRPLPKGQRDDDAGDLPEDEEDTSGKAAPETPAGKTPASSKNGQPDAKSETDPKKELERVNAELKLANEKRIPDLQRDKTKAETEARELRDQLRKRDETWWSWAKEVLTKEQQEDLRKRYSAQTATETASKANEADALTVIAEVLDDDPEFARFLRRRHRTGNKITRDNLEAWREEFKELAAAKGEGSDEEQPKGDEGKKREKKRPAARVAGAGGPTRQGGPAWRPGMSSSALIAQGFRQRES